MGAIAATPLCFDAYYWTISTIGQLNVVYYCEFDNGKWVWLENFHYIGKDESKFNKKLKGFIDGSKSKLMVLLDEYNKITNTQLYRNDDFNGFLDTQNNFEDYLFDSKQWSEKEMIELIEGEIRRLKMG